MTGDASTPTASAPDLVRTAEREIAAILQRVERDTGTVVRAIHLRDSDVTRLGTAHPEILRAVVIDYERLPGTAWQT